MMGMADIGLWSLALLPAVGLVGALIWALRREEPYALASGIMGVFFFVGLTVALTEALTDDDVMML